MSIVGLRILIVEDEALIAMMAEDLLESIGCVVVRSAANVEDALAAVALGDFDVAMLDVNLNGEPSMVVADAVRACGKPYVFTTGYGANGVESDHADVPILAKPYVLADLEIALAGCTGRAGTQSTVDHPAGRAIG